MSGEGGKDWEDAWRPFGGCVDADPDLFYPEASPTVEARKICQECAVREECLEYALRHGERYGLWGGMSERERKRIRRQRALKLTELHETQAKEST